MVMVNRAIRQMRADEKARRCAAPRQLTADAGELSISLHQIRNGLSCERAGKTKIPTVVTAGHLKAKVIAGSDTVLSTASSHEMVIV
jgi:hypothetical protein